MTSKTACLSHYHTYHRNHTTILNIAFFHSVLVFYILLLLYYNIIKCKYFCDVCDFCDILFSSSAGFHFIAKTSALDYPDGGFLCLIWGYDMRLYYLKNRFQTATAFELLSLCSMSIPTGQLSCQDSGFMIIPTPRFSTDNIDFFLLYM